MNILEKILEEIEKRVNFRKNLVGYEKENGTIMDVERNRGAMEELIIVIKIINSCIDEAEECIFREICASVPKERSAIPLETEQRSVG